MAILSSLIPMAGRIKIQQSFILINLLFSKHSQLYIHKYCVNIITVLFLVTSGPGESSSPDDFPLVGVSVAGVIIIATPTGAIIIVVIVVVRHKRKKKEKNEEKGADKEGGENGDKKCSIFICTCSEL